MLKIKKTPLLLITLFLIVTVLSGCSSYKLRGTVLEGAKNGGGSSIMVVDKDDTRLSKRGLGGVSIDITQEPLSLGHKQVGKGVTDGKGKFSIPISSFGAGFLEYQMGIIARRKAHAPAQRIMQLPGSDKRLLIILSSGQDKLDKKHIDNLQNALEESQPYFDK